jgi:hypothetical protein
MPANSGFLLIGLSLTLYFETDISDFNQKSRRNHWEIPILRSREARLGKEATDRDTCGVRTGIQDVTKRGIAECLSRYRERVL